MNSGVRIRSFRERGEMGCLLTLVRADLAILERKAYWLLILVMASKESTHNVDHKVSRRSVRSFPFQVLLSIVDRVLSRSSRVRMGFSAEGSEYVYEREYAAADIVDTFPVGLLITLSVQAVPVSLVDGVTFDQERRLHRGHDFRCLILLLYLHVFTYHLSMRAYYPNQMRVELQ